MSALLTIDDATVRFGQRTALDGLDLEVAPAEVVGVLGPSGSGKSTLLRAVAGLQRLDAGRVVLDGRDLAGVPPHQRGVGLMFQDHALFPHRDVAGNIAFGLRMQQRPKAEVTARLRELLDLVDLRGLEHRAVQTLSGGEQQRVALARALAPNPRVLLLDEPLGALDRTLRDRLLVELQGLFSRLQLTVVSVTHDQREAFALADRVVVMDAGRTLREGPPSEVWMQPGSRRVAELLGLANLIDVEVVHGHADTPWGVVPVAAPDGPVSLLLRAGGIQRDPAGTIEGIVARSTFEGDRVVLEVVTAPAAPALEVHISSQDPVAVGMPMRLTINPSAVIPLTPT